ncbi:MAG TPA: vanadium-dependent haloperoxidase [Kofleriaceae bacterium]|nr:vanadium-dependent haloperoxidase [Kofleriaceae bacterium]
MAQGIAYGDPWVPPPRPTIPPDWIEHRAVQPHPSIAYAWVEILLEATERDIHRVHAPRPTIIARQMVVPLTAMYDAWAAYDARAVGTRLGGKLRRPPRERTPANRAKALSYAMYRGLAGIFTDDQPWLADQMRKQGYDPADASTDVTTPQGIGNVAAAAVLAYRRHDGSNQFGDEPGSDGQPYSDFTYYEPRNPVDRIKDPDRWQQIPFEDSKGGVTRPNFLTPHWYRVKPFALERGDQFRSPPQPRVGSAQLRQEVAEVVAYNGSLSLEQKAIVEFMRDGPRSTGQSGHWLKFAEDVSRRDHYGVDQDVKLFFAVGNTGLDAFIAAWDVKRFYDSARPYSLVRFVGQLFGGQSVRGYLGPGKGFGTIPATQWHPYSPGSFVTPPFPGYVSGHSTVSAACAKLLELFTGSDRLGVYYRHVVGSATEPDATVAQMQAVDGVPPVGLGDDKTVVLMMPTLSGTAEMAGLSRIMGGYHIQSDNIEGLKLGRAVAQYGWGKYQAYFDGTARVAE